MEMSMNALAEARLRPEQAFCTSIVDALVKLSGFGSIIRTASEIVLTLNVRA